MDNTDSPEVGGASAANAGHRRNNERDDQSLPDSWPHRKLIKSRSQCGLAFYEVLGRRNRVHYEIVSQSKTWRFPLFFSADSKWDRLIRSGGA